MAIKGRPDSPMKPRQSSVSLQGVTARLAVLTSIFLFLLSRCTCSVHIYPRLYKVTPTRSCSLLDSQSSFQKDMATPGSTPGSCAPYGPHTENCFLLTSSWCTTTAVDRPTRWWNHGVFQNRSAIPTLGKWEQEDWEFKVTLSYTASVRPAWATRWHIPKKKRERKEWGG